MNHPPRIATSPMFDQIGVWLMDRGLREAGVEVIVQGFGRRLVQAGVSLHRLSLGGMLLHPVFGALDVVWNARDDTVVSQMMPRQSIATEAFRHSPFYWAISTPSPCQVADHAFPGPRPAGYLPGQILRQPGARWHGGARRRRHD